MPSVNRKKDAARSRPRCQDGQASVMEAGRQGEGVFKHCGALVERFIGQEDEVAGGAHGDYRGSKGP